MNTLNSLVLRPRQAAAYCGISLPTFYRYARNDPDFPRLIKIGPNVTVVRAADLDRWLQVKAGGVA